MTVHVGRFHFEIRMLFARPITILLPCTIALHHGHACSSGSKSGLLPPVLGVKLAAIGVTWVQAPALHPTEL